ncbi:hypothetical protein [Flavobacterium sp. H122]|uniref:hypothetical protein n=1 Tax=Flavobacterium sp. H122 TaxID=2529860 RepID=UPI0010AB35DC|nr:hypothetical protein [Flavobacterium sp. H122]
MKKGIFIFLTSLLFFGCQYFEKNVPSKDVLLKKELEKINWQTVDEYPTLADCDSVTREDAKKQCFFNALTIALYQKIGTDSVRMLLPKLDSLQVKISIYPDKKTTFETILPSSAINPEFTDSIIQSKLIDFPVIEPAIKRGVKVKSEFIIPLVLKGE